MLMLMSVTHLPKLTTESVTHLPMLMTWSVTHLRMLMTESATYLPMLMASSTVSGISLPSVSGSRKLSSPDSSAVTPKMIDGSGCHTASCENGQGAVTSKRTSLVASKQIQFGILGKFCGIYYQRFAHERS